MVTFLSSDSALPGLLRPAVLDRPQSLCRSSGGIGLPATAMIAAPEPAPSRCGPCARQPGRCPSRRPRGVRLYTQPALRSPIFAIDGGGAPTFSSDSVGRRSRSHRAPTTLVPSVQVFAADVDSDPVPVPFAKISPDPGRSFMRRNEAIERDGSALPDGTVVRRLLMRRSVVGYPQNFGPIAAAVPSDRRRA